jgi:hypothetical protein
VSVVRVTLAVSVTLLVAVVAYALTRSPPRVLRTVEKPTVVLTSLTADGEACQDHEVLPAGTSAIRVSLASYVGARVRLRVYSGSQLLTEGSHNPDWSGTSVTVPVRPLSHNATNVAVCFDVAPNSESIYLFGSEAPPAQALAVPGTGERLQGRLNFEYLAPGRASWWSLLLTVSRHVGLGRVFSGTWIVLLIAALVAGVGILAGGLTLRELS